ncbi:MAG: FAS1-like dehydratase domain-containing protein [Noviherbaspirillum sp.]
MDIALLREWLGRVETRSDRITAAPIAALAATLDREDPPPAEGDPLPPLRHWLYFQPLHRQSESGPDGYALGGAFLPPVSLPRRMWAGSRVRFHQPLRVGDEVSRVSRIADISRKQGRGGPLVFVQVRHELSNRQGLALSEEQDIVYRDRPRHDGSASLPRAAPVDCQWMRVVQPDPTLLFRYSALTFNAHRIHYDRHYATQTAAYPGLVVHGPLIATLLLDTAWRKLRGPPLAQFSFRAIRPVFDTAPFKVCGRLEKDGKTLTLWCQDAEGWLAMEARADLD